MGVSQPLQARDDRSDEYLTPPDLLAKLGAFDLDPCTPVAMPWQTAAKRYTKAEDGLHQPWEGWVWLNPPYGPRAVRWLDKLAHHGNGIALVFARTDTEMFFDAVWGRASAILFLRGRIHFYLPDGTRCKHNCGGPVVLIAYGRDAAESLFHCDIEGQFIDLRSTE